MYNSHWLLGNVLISFQKICCGYCNGLSHFLCLLRIRAVKVQRNLPILTVDLHSSQNVDLLATTDTFPLSISMPYSMIG